MSHNGRGVAARLARRCILAALCSQAAGCLDDPPTFAPRGQIPPLIITGQVFPPINLIHTDPSGFVVNAPFRSEDVNIDLDARLYLDLLPGVAEARFGGRQTVGASVLEDESRSVTVEYERALPVGCHSMTLILTHETNYGSVSQLPLDDTRAARVVWWLNIEGDGDTPMSSCPTAPTTDL